MGGKIDEGGKIVGDTTTTTIEWEQNGYENEIEIFPNPATDYIIINQNELTELTYLVYNENGILEDEIEVPNMA